MRSKPSRLESIRKTTDELTLTVDSVDALGRSIWRLLRTSTACIYAVLALMTAISLLVFELHIL